jgi:uncharacterized protein
MSLIPEKLAEILVCPADRGGLIQIEADSKLECRNCGRRYPVLDGIPVMLLERAEMPDE